VTLMPPSEALSRSIFTEDHDALRESIRAFVDRETVPHVHAWGELPMC
jgi:hypothetical protein